MPRRLLDGQAGALPVIRSDRDSVIFHMQIPGRVRDLVLRCDDAGNVWASIAGTERRDERPSRPHRRTWR